MNRSHKFLTLGIYLIIFPIAVVAAATDSGASIIMMTTLNTTYTTNSMDMSGDGSLMAVGIQAPTDDNISLYDIPDSFTGTNSLKWTIDKNYLVDVAINQDGSRIFSTDTGTDIISCYSSDGITPIWELTPSTQIYSSVVSENGDYVCYIDLDGTYSANLISGTDKSAIWSTPLVSFNKRLDVSNTGKVLLIYGTNNVTFLDHDEIIWTTDLIVTAIQPFISNDDNFIVLNTLNGTDDTLFALDGSGNILWQYQNNLSSSGVALAKESKDVIACTYSSDTEKIVFFKSGSTTPDWEIQTDTNNNIAAIANNGKIAAVSDYDNHLKIIETDTGEVLSDHSIGSGIKTIEISDQGDKVAILTYDKNIIVYSIEVDGNFLDNFLNTFTDLDNLYGLLATFGVAFILGAILFGRRKK